MPKQLLMPEDFYGPARFTLLYRLNQRWKDHNPPPPPPALRNQR